jgi:hypothetical protein
MRTTLLLASLMVAAVACGGRDDAANADSGVAATPATPAAPATGGTLSESDIAGIWHGHAMGVDSDTVIARFTQTCGNGRCRGLLEGAADSTSATTYRLEGDSLVAASAAYRHPDFGVQVVDAVVLRMRGDSLVGMGVVRMADRDSVLARMRLVATRAPR